MIPSPKNKIHTLFFFLFVFFVAISNLKAELYDPISVYLTWQRSPDTTITVGWITQNQRTDDNVEYRRVGESTWKQVKGIHRSMPENYPFLIHHVEIIGLLPDTDYQIRTGSDAVIYKFRTMPSALTTPIRFIVGGDIYHDGLDILEKMNLQAAKLSPMFALCGGDLAYNSDKPSAYPGIMPRWMDWLIAWKKQMVTPEGRLIPLIPAIGNHEVNGHYGKTPKDAPFFYSLFEMPGWQGYNVLDFGKYMSIILLDSGHTHSIRGKQTQWLYQTLNARKDVPNKFVIYHVAAFPSVRKFDGKIQEQIRRYWVPLFEQFGVKNVFENHDHAYKRTRPIKNKRIDPTGIVYVGDGGWAVEDPRPVNPLDTWYLAKAIASRNVVLVTLQDTMRHFIAIDDNGTIIDEFIGKD
jgi:hypothetical protein